MVITSFNDATRQGQLKRIAGMQPKMCFWVVASCRNNKPSTEQVQSLIDRLSDEDKQKLGKEPVTTSIPTDSPFSNAFNANDRSSTLILDNSGKSLLMTSFTSIQPVYYSLNYREPPSLCHTDSQLDAIISGYKEQLIDTLKPTEIGANYFDNEQLNIIFKFLVSSYDFDLCHPAQEGKLQPLTLPTAQVIKPAFTSMP